jgi:DNA-binding transcriptional MocR family regulator
MSLVLDFAPDHWNTGTRLVALALADRVGSDNTCWPSIEDIAKRTGLSHRHVQRTLSYLEAEGIITHERRWRPNGSRQSNLWTWLWTTVPVAGDNRTPMSPHNRTPTSPWL